MATLMPPSGTAAAPLSKGARRRQRRQERAATHAETPGDRYARERRAFLNTHGDGGGDDARDRVWRGSMVDDTVLDGLGGVVLKDAFVTYLEGHDTRDEPDRERAQRVMDTLRRESPEGYDALHHTIGQDVAQVDAAAFLGCSVATLQIRVRVARAVLQGIHLGLALGDDARAAERTKAAAAP